MKAQLAKEFQTRIVNANQNDLVIINYEMLIAELDDAIYKYEHEDSKGFAKNMHQATRVLRELSDNLDFQYEISKDLMSLYIFMNKKFIEASQKNSTQPLQSAKDVLNVLLLGWQQAAKEQIKTAPLIQNGQQVYAGLTYGKGQLNETVYTENSRGYKA
jgi:flagellar protein FliS